MIDMNKIVLSLVLVVVLMVNCVCFGAELGSDYWWKEYKVDNYRCAISKIGLTTISIGDKFFPSILSPTSGIKNSQWGGPENIKSIEGTEEEIPDGKVYTINGEYNSGIEFVEKVTCTAHTVKIEYQMDVKGIVFDMPVIYDPRGKEQMNIFNSTIIKYVLEGAEKDIKQLKKGEVLKIRTFDNPHVKWIEIVNYNGKKIRIEVLKGASELMYEVDNLGFGISESKNEEGYSLFACKFMIVELTEEISAEIVSEGEPKKTKKEPSMKK
jgi:hypothetical protein